LSQILVFLILVALTFLCAEVARRVALRKRRSPLPWMWSVALLGPLPLIVLGLLPAQRDARAETP
jgi:hypothetical protein